MMSSASADEMTGVTLWSPVLTTSSSTPMNFFASRTLARSRCREAGRLWVMKSASIALTRCRSASSPSISFIESPFWLVLTALGAYRNISETQALKYDLLYSSRGNVTSFRKLLNPSVTASSIAAIGTLALLAGIAPASNAAPLARTDTPTITSTPTSTSNPSKKPNLISGGGGVTITCTATANNPHDSSHVGGTVNFVGSVSCTAPVASLKLTLSLYWDGYLQASNIKSNAGFASISNNVAAPCTSGGWQGTTYASVVFPPGFSPASGVISDSNVKSISC